MTEVTLRAPLAAALLFVAACGGQTTGGGTPPGDGQTTGGVTPPGCTLSTTGGPLVRLANFAPDNGPAVDVCMRPAGTQTWGKTLLLEGGTACQAGFDYPQVSVAFAAPASTIDVKLVPTGSRCDAGALTEGDGLALATGVVTTLVRIGGAGTPEQILALPEDAPQTSGSFVRFVHAAPGLGSLDFGTTINTTLPASLTQSLFAAPVAFGAVSPAGNATCCNLTVDDHGYLHLPAVEVRFAAATTPTGSALWVWTCSGRAATFSVYTIGVQGDATHPIEAVACNEGAFAPTAVGQTLSCQTQP